MHLYCFEKFDSCSNHEIRERFAVGLKHPEDVEHDDIIDLYFVKMLRDMAKHLFNLHYIFSSHMFFYGSLVFLH